MRNKIFKVAIITIIFVLGFSFAKSFAEENNVNKKIILETESSIEKINPGDEIKVNVKLKKENDSDKNIVAFQGEIEYDSNVLEIVGDESDGMLSMESKDSWEVNFSKDSNFIAGIVLSDESTENVCTMVFKVKNDVNCDNTTIKMKNLKVANDTYQYTSQEDVSLKLGKVKNNNLYIIIGICVAIVVIIIIVAVIIKKKK